MRDRKRNNGCTLSRVPTGGHRYAAPTHPLLTLQRLAGNQAVLELLGVQRHALKLDELTDENIEQDLQVQRVALATPAEVPQAEHNRLLARGADITRRAQAAYNELAGTRGGDTNKAVRHVGKAFQRGMLVEPSPIVEVDHTQLPLPRQQERLAQGADFRWFWWNKPEGEDYAIDHRQWGGGLATRLQVGVAGAQILGLGIRDIAANDRPLLKRILVHEAVHQMQWEQGVQQDEEMETRYRREFEAYWVSGEFGRVRGADRRAERIRTHIVGANGQDANTVYPEIRDWYHGQATPAERATIDGIRIGNVGGLAWWQTNIHMKRLLGELAAGGDDATRLREWRKLSRSEKRRALADPALAHRLRNTVSVYGGAFSRAVGA